MFYHILKHILKTIQQKVIPTTDPCCNSDLLAFWIRSLSLCLSAQHSTSPQRHKENAKNQASGQERLHRPPPSELLVTRHVPRWWRAAAETGSPGQNGQKQSRA
eukprot:3253593-Amphidinium_carterae.1